jgi:hypothetical protein
MATRAEFQRKLAGAFTGQGWPYEPDVRERLSTLIERDGGADGDRLAAAVPADYLDRHGIDRTTLARVLGRAIGGEAIEPEPEPVSITIADNRHSINIGDNVTLANSSFNTGTQITSSSDTSREDVLAAVAMLFRAGLDGEWNHDAAADLGRVIDARGDVSFEDVHGTAVEVANEQPVKAGRVKALLNDLSLRAIGGALGTGLVAALGALL